MQETESPNVWGGVALWSELGGHPSHGFAYPRSNTYPMRERITFTHDPEDVFDPNQLQLGNSSLHVSNLKAAREDRFTFGFQELPQEV